jgi:hypothetical protein
MQNKLIENNVHFPDFWDLDKVLHAFTTMSTLELYAYFESPSATSFSRMMNKYMLDRPSRVTFADYIRSII